MSSVNWAKFQKGQSKAILMHCDGDERVCRSHSNVHIDTSKTNQNIALGLCEQREVLYKTFDDIVNKCNEKQVTESGKKVRKDQIQLIGLSITVPKDLAKEKYEDWFRDTYEVLCKTYGKRVLGADCHFDEVHEYTDVRSGEKVESRPHMHAFVVPEVDGKLNGKAFVTRKAMTSINNTLQKMTQENYGCDFMDGTKKKSLGSVEEMKSKSSVYEAKRDGFNQGYNDGLKAAESRAEEIEQAAREKMDEAEKRNSESKVLSKTLQDEKSAVAQKKNSLDIREMGMNQRESVIESNNHESIVRNNASLEREKASKEILEECKAIKSGFENVSWERLKTAVLNRISFPPLKESITILFDNFISEGKRWSSRVEKAESRFGYLKSDNQDEDNQELGL